ncbi:MAG: late competence development ComFB family protein [Acaryochloris sp. RU_4_1]|nr:late competence development ComFB family protein [Acaryochloris sp. RU_4_1]NJR53598.1 late competence development ComFB family protein [Acaryochloris sp. CRU_2_0]
MVPSYDIANSYKNIMEILVDEEIDQQTCSWTSEDAQQVNRIEVAAHALNHLPPLYASSQEGVMLQYERAQQDYYHEIKTAVNNSLLAVKRLPYKGSTPFDVR